MAELTNTNDLSSGYMAYRQDSSTDDLIARMQARVNARAAGAGAPDGAQPAATEAAAAGGDPASPDATVSTSQPGAAVQAPVDQPARFKPGTERTGGQALSAVGGDVVRGLVQAPRQMVGGLSDAVHNAFTAADRFADWLNENVADLRYGDADSFNPLQAAAGQKNEVAPPDTVTGALVRDVSRFLTSFIPALRGAKAAGLGATAANVTAVTAAGAADAVTREPTEENLSNLLRDHAGLKDSVTAYLAADPNDSEATARFKKGLEGMGLGIIGEGMVYAVRAVRAARLAGKPVGEVTDALADARARHGEVTDEHFSVLGDPNAPMLTAAPEAPRADPTAKLQAAIDATGGTQPSAKKLSTLATRAQKAQAAMDKADGAPRTLDDLERIEGEQAAAGHKAILDVVDEIRGGGAEREPGSGMTSWLVRNGGLQNQGGEVSYIIGSQGKTRPGLISGKGMTLDDAALKAWEDGFFPELQQRPTVDEFLEAMRGDYDRSQPRFHKEDWATREHERYLSQFEDELDQAGIDWRNLDREQLAKQLDTMYPRDEGAVTGAGGRDLARHEAEMPAPVKDADLGGNKITVNFARIQTPDDVKAVMGAMADQFAGKMHEARRGVQSNEMTEKLADELGMSVADLLSRRQGQPLNAEQALAARQLWASSAEKLLETARLAAGPNAGPVDQFNFRRMLATHYAIQAEVLGARAETARALQSWSIPAGGSIERARAVDEAVRTMGGASFTKDMASRLVVLAEAGVDAGALGTFTRRTWAATTTGAVQEAWINALLSNPKTHIVNVTSNWVVAFQQVYERAIAEQGRMVVGGGNGVVPGEAAALAYGLVTGIKDAWRLSWQAVKRDVLHASAADGDAASVALPIGSKIDNARVPAIGSEAFGMSSETGLGRAVDFLGHVTRTPGNLLGAEDAFFKSIGYRMEVHAQSLRQASQEGLQGDALYRRVAELANDPPQHIRLAAADQASYQTFTNQTGKVGEALSQMRTNVPVTAFIMPFINTPVNIARYSFERTPLAPLVGQWRADMAAGGARADLAMARLATGTTIVLSAADLADNGMCSGKGPSDAGEREALVRQGWKPYACRVGGEWYEYNRLDPFGVMLGAAADFTEIVKRADIHPEKMDETHEWVGALIAATSNTVVNKTYMQGIAQFFQMVAEGERYAPAYITRFLGSFVPAGVNAIKNADDPTQRETMKLFDGVVAHIPVWAESLTPKRDLWGEAKKPESGFGRVYDALSPIAASPVKKSPIDAELTRLGYGPEQIGHRAAWGGVPVNFRDWPQVYDAYQRLAGNDLKNEAFDGMGAKDFLDAVVTGKSRFAEIYKLGQDTQDPNTGGKAQFIQQTINQYRKDARAAIEADPKFADFRAMLDAGRAKRDAQRAPVGSGMEAPAAAGGVQMPRQQ